MKMHFSRLSPRGAAMRLGLGVGLLLGMLLTPAGIQLGAAEPSGVSAAAAIEESFVKAIETAEKSVVAIAKDRRLAGAVNVDRRGFFGDGRRPPDFTDPSWVASDFGAGIVIDKGGLILTNYHVVRGGPIKGRPEDKSEFSLYVRLPDRRGFEATIFAADPRSDLAVISIDCPDLVPMKIEAVPTPKKGQMVLALGNPYALARDGSASASWGIIGNISRQAGSEGEVLDLERRKAETVHHLGTLLQIDTRLELGTSGGALLNLKGECIGITTTMAAIVGYEKSTGFAVPFDESMKRIIETLRQGKEVEYGFLGVSLGDISPMQTPPPQWEVIRDRIRRGAPRVEVISRGLPAERAGLYPDDIILKVRGRDVFNRSDMMREIGLSAPGEKVTLTLFRAQRGNRGKPDFEVVVELGKWPAIDDEGIVAPNPTYPAWRGLSCDYSSCRQRFLTVWGPQLPMEGVRVMKVAPLSPAAIAQLQAGDLIMSVNSKPVHSPREFNDLVAKANGTVSLRVWSASNSDNPAREVEIRP